MNSAELRKLRDRLNKALAELDQAVTERNQAMNRFRHAAKIVAAIREEYCKVEFEKVTK